MQENGNKNRIPEIDILKGIAIILVVIGHTRVPGNSFIYLFHMAVFFIASGYFYSEKSSETLQWTSCMGVYTVFLCCCISGTDRCRFVLADIWNSGSCRSIVSTEGLEEPN